MHKIPPEALAASRRAKIRETLLDLLIKEKKEDITVHCGLKALDQIMQMPEFSRSWDDKSLNIADCYIEIKRDFELDPWKIVYNGDAIFN